MVRRITEPADDAGGLAVSMKLENEINQLEGAANNIANAISFLQVQDGILETFQYRHAFGGTQINVR